MASVPVLLALNPGAYKCSLCVLGPVWAGCSVGLTAGSRDFGHPRYVLSPVLLIEILGLPSPLRMRSLGVRSLQYLLYFLTTIIATASMSVSEMAVIIDAVATRPTPLFSSG